VSLQEDNILAQLRNALTPSRSTWTAARYFPADRAERTSKVIVAAARTTDFSDTIASLDGVELRPYGIHHHTLIVGWRARDQDVTIDVSRFSDRSL
jgi:hypothetical protein